MGTSKKHQHPPFEEERKTEMARMKNDSEFIKLTKLWIENANRLKYMYKFDWLGRPIIQYPEDIVTIQNLIFQVKPTLIIETGIAHGGSLVLSASMLALLDLESCSRGKNGEHIERKVIGIDVEIRDHNKHYLNEHFLNNYITLLEGSSISTSLYNRVQEIASNHSRIMVLLDSNHSHEHVLKELQMYSKLVTDGSYCVVFDTIIDNLPDSSFAKPQHQRSWNSKSNPKTAINEFLKYESNFIVDEEINLNLVVSGNPSGFLKRI